MDETRLKRLGIELAKARKRRDEWEAKVKDLERRYKEAENTCIHDMVQPYVLPASAVGTESGPEDEENYLDDIDDEKEEIEG